ncbi:hypothetical protein [Egicoccus halophilus]|uniref:Uncharacterized protein n=1 Tax=Egicoccus halophilus TaxID=1670830 RepID=A0A8J3A8W7_9ACTN|nr:hypothetical protein [Egicoccus halophilus]GGI07409.1 hypothetical protein GCM10011354_23940 [Egicoccus halophilus]
MGRIIGGVVDEPDWVSWRWSVGLAGAVTVVGAWLFGFGSPAWFAAPVLAAMAVPRLRDRPGVAISPAAFLAQNVPAVVILGLVVRDAVTLGELGPLVASSAGGFVLLIGVWHGLWMGRDRGAVAGLGVALAGWCAALVVSGWLAPLEEAYLVMGVLLLLGGDIVTTLSPQLREDIWLWPTLGWAAFLLVFAGIPLLDGELVAQASAVLATVTVGLPVAWSIKRSARRQERSRWRVSR